MRLRSFLAIAALFAAATDAGPAASEPVGWARPYAGPWTLSGVTEGAPYCPLTLGTEGVIGGATLEISPTCRRNFPLEEVTGWTLRGDQLVLIDALRQAQISFSRVESGGFMGALPTGEAVSLDRGRPPAPRSRKDLLDGTFTLSGSNNAGACGFAVTAASATAGSLEQAGECAEPWKGRDWRRWSFAGGRLNLLAADGSTILSLPPGDAFTFVAEGPEGPVFFGPGVIVTDQ